ncbi:grpE protein homolog 1, mitochondrial-like [Pollicipes pollicipes]|uniref:grpE protein homolog 1, mitochondrial-like n=1 Tax=Pollicipes pollicipes TaxID=41117 RepID=UPI00188543A7|nr:grpE protein homolog 1, mitochondrial-like [Pollicipes pollicipes]
MPSAASIRSLASKAFLMRGIIRQPAWTLQSTFCSATPQTPASDAAASAPPSPPPPPAEELQKQIEQLKGQIEDLDDKYKRSLADRENVRTRLEKQVQDSKIYGIQSFCKDLLDVADILGKATESVPPEEITDRNPHLKSLFEGLKMTEAQLFTVFRRHGVVQINPLGEKFDPHLHEALFEQPVEGHQPGDVCLVTKLGYQLHGRTIRPALVGVAKAPPQ